MRLLFIVPYVPTLIRVRPYNFIKTLRRRGHQITLFTLTQSIAELTSLNELRQLGIEVIAFPLSAARSALNTLLTVPSSQPLQANYCWHIGLAQAVRSYLRANHVDAIHIEHLRGARYGLWIKESMPGLAVPVIWDGVDCITYLFEQASRQSQSLKTRLLTQFELGRTRQYEGQLIREFERVIVTSRKDKVELLGIAAASVTSDRIAVVTNGVDLDVFHPTSNKSSDTVVFSGKMSYHANSSAAIYLASQIMPLVWQQLPLIRLMLVGSRPPRNIQELTRDSRIKVTGYVPDMSVPLREATVSVAPILYGAGIQNKVLEAMACATPVVASPQAVAALDISHGTECLVATSPQSFAAEILALLSDQDLRRRISRSGREFVQKQHNWDNIGQLLESIYIQ